MEGKLVTNLKLVEVNEEQRRGQAPVARDDAVRSLTAHGKRDRR